MADNVTVQPEDLFPVRSRVSWGSIFAGAVVALATWLVLTLLGGVLGLAVSDDVREGTLATGAGIWAVASTIIALFLGGLVTSQCAVGENKVEAAVHGIIMWGVVLAMILWLVSSGMRTGFSAMWGLSSFSNAAFRGADDWETAARRAGVPPEVITEGRRRAEAVSADARRMAEDPAARQAAIDYATRATGYALLGTLLSMAAAVVGALVGSGPTFRLGALGVFDSRVVIQHTQTAGHR